jgi:polyphosphate kinase
MGSPDWMPRNFYERVEVVFPVRDALLRQRVQQEILAAYLADTTKARILHPDGEYVRAGTVVNGRGRTNRVRFNAQEFLIALAEGRESLAAVPALPMRIPRSRQRERVEQL